MAIKESTQLQMEQNQSFDVFDLPSASPKINKAAITDKVLKILQNPFIIKEKELIQKVTPTEDPFDDFDFQKFKEKIKK